MIRALLFDCYGVLLVDTPAGRVRNSALLTEIARLRQVYRTALISNADRASIAHRFEAAELTALFDVISLSGDTGYAKPDRRAYESVAAALAVAPQECLIIDDTDAYCEAARTTGMQALQYRSLHLMRRELAEYLTKDR